MREHLAHLRRFAIVIGVIAAVAAFAAFTPIWILNGVLVVAIVVGALGLIWAATDERR